MLHNDQNLNYQDVKSFQRQNILMLFLYFLYKAED